MEQTFKKIIYMFYTLSFVNLFPGQNQSNIYLSIFTSSLCSQLCDELNEKEKTADGEAKKVKGQCQGHFG